MKEKIIMPRPVNIALRKGIFCLVFMGLIYVATATGAHAVNSTHDEPPPVQPLQNIVWYVQILTGFATVLILGMSMWLSNRSLALSNRSLELTEQSLRLSESLKRTDVLVECSRRYDLLFESRLALLGLRSPRPEQVEAYFSRFWELQETQFNYWSKGLIDEATFEQWMRHRHNEYMDQTRVILGRMTSRNGWELGNKQCGIIFNTFMSNVFKHGVGDAIKLHKSGAGSSDLY